MAAKFTLLSALSAAGLSFAAMAGGALADGEPGGSNDAPAPEGRQFAWSFTAAAVSEYVFRGISQTNERPAFQPSLDMSYGVFYAGIWGSTLDFGNDEFLPPFVFGENAQIEIDIYAGVKPVWGPVNFDFAVLGYLYPSASDSAGELDYAEIKAAYSTTGLLIPKLTAGTALYYSPEYGGELGETLSVESTIAYELPQFGAFTPTVSGLFGTLYGSDETFTAAFSDDKYNFWNAGLSLAVEKFTFDFRYWDTDLATVAGLPCEGGVVDDVFSCDERFVFTAKVTLP